MRTLQIIFLIVFYTSLSFCQRGNVTVDKKIAPSYLKIISGTEKDYSYLYPGVTQKPGKIDKSVGYHSVIRTDFPQKIRGEGIDIHSVITGFVTAHLTTGEMLALSDLEEVIYISPGEVNYPNNNVASGLTGADLVRNGYVNFTGYDGADVIIVIVDTGIDWDHLDFRDPTDNTQSRILYLWDMSLAKQGSENTPEDRDNSNFSGLDYGVEYISSDINDEIDGTPAAFVRSADTYGHGTHVAGSAAGNGSTLTTGIYAGMAPKADIVVVKLNTFSSAEIIDALDYAERVADTESKPVVVNMSLGGHTNAHDGTSSQDVAVDNFTGGGNGQVAVISAGNEGDQNIHISGTVNGSSSADVTFTVPSYSASSGSGNDYFIFDLWLDDASDFTATCTTPNSHSYSRTSGNYGESATDDGTILIYNIIDGSHTNGDRRIYLRIYDSDEASPPADGTYTLTLQNNTGTAVSYHGWLAVTTIPATLDGGDSDYTVASPGVASGALTVGASVSRWRWTNSGGSSYTLTGTDRSDDIADFSSIGPTRGGAQKPDIAAPGQVIISTTSSDYSPNYKDVIVSGSYHKAQGTSMASPVAAGAVALLLDYNSSLTASQVKTLITDNADTDSFTGVPPGYDWGYGKLNIFRALVKAVNSGWTNTQTTFVYDTWSVLSDVAISNTQKVAVRFSPASDGDITGVYFHTGGSLTLSGPLNFEIWSNSGSLPAAKTGSAVSFDEDKIMKYSWNYADLTDAGVSVSSGTDYHIVCYYTSGSAFSILSDAGSIDNRSSVYSGSWSAYGSADFKLRPVSSVSSTLLPVELAAFTAAISGTDVRLSWKTETEIENFGFGIQRKKCEDNKWSDIGFVEGSGTSSSEREYSFIDEKPSPGCQNYRLKQIDINGETDYSESIEIRIELPESYALQQNFPNPFNPSTKIEFSLPAPGRVRLNIYDCLGRKVSTLLDEYLSAGYHSYIWDASGLNSGVYFYSLRAGEFSGMKKSLLIK